MHITLAPTWLDPAGAAGIIAAAPVDPLHAYRVRFMDGSEASLKREEIVVLKHHQREGGMAVAAKGMARDDLDLKRYVILRCVIGSRAYGLNHAGSDTDYRGVYLPPADLEWSIRGVPE